MVAWAGLVAVPILSESEVVRYSVERPFGVRDGALPVLAWRRTLASKAADRAKILDPGPFIFPIFLALTFTFSSL